MIRGMQGPVVEDATRRAVLCYRRAQELLTKLGPPPRNVEVKWVMRMEVLALLRSNDIGRGGLGQSTTFQTTLFGIPIRTDLTCAVDEIRLVFLA